MGRAASSAQGNAPAAAGSDMEGSVADSGVSDSGVTGGSVTEALLVANQQVRATIVSNAIQKTLLGSAVGTVISLALFKRTPPDLSGSLPRSHHAATYAAFATGRLGFILFTTGIGIGVAYGDASRILSQHHEDIRQRAARMCHAAPNDLP